MEATESYGAVELLKLARHCHGIDKYVSSSVGLSIDEMHCLSALFTDRPPSVKRLSELISVTPTRASQILRSLEQRQFVSRTLDAADRRKEVVDLTESGRRTVDTILQLFSEVGSELLANWRKTLDEQRSGSLPPSRPAKEVLA